MFPYINAGHSGGVLLEVKVVEMKIPKASTCNWTRAWSWRDQYWGRWAISS